MEENKGITFYRDGVCNYMVLQCPPACGENYQYRMLAANQIHGLLTCSRRSIDNQEYLYYDITSRQSLADLFDRRQVRGTDLEKLLRDLLRMEDILTEYLLDVSRLILDPACIYADFREQEYSFVYYPGEDREADWAALFLFLADRVDGKDKSAAALVYRLCMMAEKPGFRLQAGMLEELGMDHLYKKTDNPSIRAGGQPPAWPAFEGSLLSGSGDRDGARCAGAGSGKAGAPLYRGPDLWMDADQADEGGGGKARLYHGNGKSQLHHGGGEENASGRRARLRRRGREEDGADGEPDRRNGKTARSAAALPAAILMAAAGGGLLTGSFYLELEETAVILMRAGGCMIATCGLLLFAVQMIRRRRRRPLQGRGEEEEAGERWPEAGPERWKRQDMLEGQERYEGHDGYENPPGGFYGEEPVCSGDLQPDRAGVSDGWSDRAGETTLLGAEPGLQAALYGLGACRGEQIRLNRLPCVVGKMREYVDQVLEDASVSRMHAKFSADREGKIRVRDLNSTNGTWLNGERLQPNETRILEQGDHLRLGSMEFVFR